MTCKLAYDITGLMSREYDVLGDTNTQTDTYRQNLSSSSELKPSTKVLVVGTVVAVLTAPPTITFAESYHQAQKYSQGHKLIIPGGHRGWKGTVAGINGEELNLSWDGVFAANEHERKYQIPYETSEYGYQSKVGERKVMIARTRSELEAIKNLTGTEISDPELERLWWGSVAFIYAFGGEFSTGGFGVKIKGLEKEDKTTVITVQIGTPQQENLRTHGFSRPFEGGFVQKSAVEGGVKVRWIYEEIVVDEEIIVDTVFQSPNGIHKGEKFGYELARTNNQWLQLKKELPLPEGVPDFAGGTRLILLSPEAPDERTHTSIAEIVKMSTRTEVRLKRETAQVGAAVFNKWVQIVDTPELTEVHWIEPLTETFEIIKKNP